VRIEVRHPAVAVIRVLVSAKDSAKVGMVECVKNEVRNSNSKMLSVSEGADVRDVERMRTWRDDRIPGTGAPRREQVSERTRNQ